MSLSRSDIRIHCFLHTWIMWPSSDHVINIYIYTYIHAYIHIYIYTYIYTYMIMFLLIFWITRNRWRKSAPRYLHRLLIFHNRSLKAKHIKHPWLPQRQHQIILITLHLHLEKLHRQKAKKIF